MEEKDTTYSSIWLFRKKRTLWSGTDQLGNIKNFKQVRGKYLSKFNPTVAENILNFWSEPNDIILDPFAGRTRALITSLKDRKYIGFEISKKAVDVIKDLIKENKKDIKISPTIYHDDSFNMDDYNLPKVDFIFSCPPYFNLEKYESCNGQLSDIKKYSQFLERYEQILNKSVQYLKKDKYCALVIGDFRIRGKFHTFHIDTINLMEKLGMKLHDIVILQSVTWDFAVRRFGGIKKHKMTAKVHEYLLVFKKI